MPLFDLRREPFKPSKDLVENWDQFRGGLNTLLKETEIKGNEMAQADNVVLIGAGVPTKRWGIKNYFNSSATGSVRGLGGYYISNGTVELLAITDQGYLNKWDEGTSFTQRAGASFASGNNAFMAQLNDRMYIVNGQREMVRYSSPTLTGFPTIAIPTSLFATQISGGSGAAIYSYRVSALSNVGETLAATAISLSNQPQDLTKGTVRFQWSGISTASGILQGYNIYGRSPADERFLGSVDQTTTIWFDDGTSIPKELTYPPTGDTTGGINAKYIARFQDRLIFAGISGEPSKVVISGRVPFQENFDISYGGNFIRIEPDAGDNVTGLATYQDRIIVFKQRSVWQITLGSLSVGNFIVTSPVLKLITASYGGISQRSVVNVENDIFFLSRKGVYVLGYEPGINLDVLRTNEISVKIRPFFKNLTIAQLKGAVATYFDSKYIVSIPGKNQTVVYDRERLAWMGPWTYDASAYEVFYDSLDNEHLLLGRDDGPSVDELASSFGDDKGTAIQMIIRTRKEDFGDWTIFKTIKDVYTNWRNVTGSISVDIRVEDVSGNVVAAKSFSVTPVSGNTGFGEPMFANVLFALSNEEGGAADIGDLVRWVNLNSNGRTVQLVIKTTNVNDNFELLGIRTFARQVGRGLKGTNWKV